MVEEEKVTPGAEKGMLLSIHANEDGVVTHLEIRGRVNLTILYGMLECARDVIQSKSAPKILNPDPNIRRVLGL